MAIESVNDKYGLQSLIREFNSGLRDSAKPKPEQVDAASTISGEMANVSNPIADSVKSSRSLPGVQSAAPIRETIEADIEDKIKPNFIKQLNEYGDKAPRVLAQHSKGVLTSDEQSSVSQYGGQTKQPIDPANNRLVTVFKNQEQNMFAPRMKVTQNTILQPEKVSDTKGSLYTPETNRIHDGAFTVKGERTVEASMGRKIDNVSGQETIVSTNNVKSTYLDSVKKAEELKDRDKAPMGFDSIKERAGDRKTREADQTIAREVRDGGLISANPAQMKDAENLLTNAQATTAKNIKNIRKTVMVENLTELNPLEQDLRYQEKKQSIVDELHSKEPNILGALAYPEGKPTILGAVEQELKRQELTPADAAKPLPEVGYREVKALDEPIYRNLPTPDMLVESQFPIENIDKIEPNKLVESVSEQLDKSKNKIQIEEVGDPVLSAIEKEFQKELQARLDSVKDTKSLFSKAANEIVNQRLSTTNERLTISALASNILGPGK